MEYLPAIIAVLVQAGALAYVLATRERERESIEAERREERLAWQATEKDLLNRIQMPEVAALPDIDPGPSYVGPDDYKGYWDEMDRTQEMEADGHPAE